MSLLEDVFLQDEADEAQDLERLIEGDEYEEIRRQNSDEDDDDGGAGRDDEAEEDKRRVDPNSTKTKRVVKNPRFVLNPARLTGPRGIHVIPEHFKDFKFKGKGHENEDLDLVLKKLEHWAYRLYPKFKFADCLKKIETLGKKRAVMVNLHKIRSDQFVNDEEAVVQKDSSDDEAPPPEDEFDKLLQQQIELARTTPARTPGRPQFGPKNDISTPYSMPKATSSPSISEEQKQRMIENRKKAEARRLARLKNGGNGQITIPENGENHENDNGNEYKDGDSVENYEKDSVSKKRHNNSNVIDSSDEENDVTERNDSINNKENTVVDEIDLTDKGIAKKVRSQVIDSEDEDVAENKERDSGHNAEEIGDKDSVHDDIEEIDLTEVPNNEENKKMVLHSDDEIGRNLDKNTIISKIDLTNVNHVTSTKKNQNRILDSDEEIDMDFDKNTNIDEIDLTNVKQNDKSKIIDGEEIDLTDSFAHKSDDKALGNKKNGLKEIENQENGLNNAENVMDSDSSDDECNVATNVSITVDVHKTNSAEIDTDFGINSKEKDKNEEDFNDIESMNEENRLENVSITENGAKNTEIVDKAIESDKNVDDIMDVDFSEAF